MTFYPPNPGGGPFPPRYRQNFEPPRPFGRQGYPPPPPFRRQAPFNPQGNPMGGQGNPYFNPNPFGNQGQPFFGSDQFGMQDPAAYNPNQPFGAPRSRGLGGQLNTLMGHMGTVTNGVNMLRQLGSIMTMFR